MARTASSSRCWGSALRRESSAGAQVKRRCSWASVSWLPQLELQLGSHFTPQRRCGQGCLTTCCPNTAEGAVELVQLCLVGVQHHGSWLGFEPHLTFSCPNLNKGKLEEKRVRLTTFTDIQNIHTCTICSLALNFTPQCTMRFPMSIDILEIHKCKNSFLAHLIVKSIHSFFR